MDRDGIRDSRATSSIWDRTFLVGIFALFSVGTLWTLDHFFSLRRHNLEAGLDDLDFAAADGDAGDADADADADD
jgi:hypothetical protein